jgi:amino acid transporter
VVAMLAINLVGSRVVDRAQSLIVVGLLAVFAVFIAVTLFNIDFDLLAFGGYPLFSDIVASVALTFFAYLGFSVITFSVGELSDPARELPQAMYLALGVTSATYVLISLGVFGTLTVDEVTGYGETAIAEAARPALGDAGFIMIAIAALLATASSVNAVLYASAGMTTNSPRPGSSRRSSEQVRGSARTPDSSSPACSSSSSRTSSICRRSPRSAAPAR